MSIKTHILQTLDDLSEADLGTGRRVPGLPEVPKPVPCCIPFPKEAQMAEMYAEFAETKTVAKAEDIIGRYR